MTKKDDLTADITSALSKTDLWLRIAGVATPAEFRILLDGSLNVMVILEHEFERRFPREHAQWEQTHDDDDDEKGA